MWTIETFNSLQYEWHVLEHDSLSVRLRRTIRNVFAPTLEGEHQPNRLSILRPDLWFRSFHNCCVPDRSHRQCFSNIHLLQVSRHVYRSQQDNIQ